MTNNNPSPVEGHTPESIKQKVIDIIYSEMRLHDDESALRSVLSSVQRIEIASAPAMLSELTSLKKEVERLKEELNNIRSHYAIKYFKDNH